MTEHLPPSEEELTGASSQPRVLAVDALRGFDMLLISGAGSFIYALHGLTGIPWVDALARQFEHAEWHGFTFFDFIFPLFLFIAGVSIPYSVSKGLAQGLSKTHLYRKAFWRMLLLIGLGILDKNAPLPIFDLAQIRWVGVLQRIGFAGFVVTVLYLNFTWQRRAIWVAGILLVYWVVMLFVPVPGYGAGHLTMEGNLHGWIDRQFLPGRLLQKIFDENGLLTQFPALCLTLLGTLAGDLLRYEPIRPVRKVLILSLVGAALIGLGILWNLHFPINKRLWSSSFICLTAGMASMFLALFYVLIDVLKYQKWAFFFQVIGLNSLTIYLAYRFIDFHHTSQLLFGGLYGSLPEGWQQVWRSVGAMMLVWFLMYWLYRRKIFFKV